MKTNRKTLLSIALSTLLTFSGYAQIGDLPRSTPEKEGIPSASITTLIDSLMQLPKTDIHSLLITRNGKVITDFHPAPFHSTYRHTLYSCSKTFTSAAVGIAVQENLIRIQDRVAIFFPDKLPYPVSDNLASITIEDLLTMQAGITPDWDFKDKFYHLVEAFLHKDVPLTPGTKFQYDSLCTYLLSAIVQEVTGKSMFDYLKEKLFAPMHITDVYWEKTPEGVTAGGWGLHIQSESMAKFGNLLLNKGVWNGKQLIDKQWVEEMMRCHVDLGGDNYCYQMWTCHQYPDAVRADGAFGQYIIIVPDYQLVVVVTEASLIDGIHQRNLIFNHLLSKAQNSAIPEDHTKKFTKTLAKYTLPYADGRKKSGLISSVEGKEISLDENQLGWKSVRFTFEPKKVIAHITNQLDEKFVIPFGYKEWTTELTKVFPPKFMNVQDQENGLMKEFMVSGSYGWTAPSVLHLKAHWVNWITGLDMYVHFNGNEIELTAASNCDFEGTIRIPGKLNK